MSRLPYHHNWKFKYQTELGLRVHWFGRYAGYPEWYIPDSRLAADMICFFFVEKNSCWVMVNGRKLILRRGDLAVISGADAFSFGQDPAKPHSSLSACFALNQGGAANALLQRRFERRYSIKKPVNYIAEFEKVLKTLASTSHYRDLEIAGALLQWLAYLMSQLRAPLDSSKHERSVVDKILTAEAWASARLKESVTLANWAKAIKLNPVYFGRIFKQETGLRPMEWLNHRRLQMACQFLSNTHKSVAEIAEACGFTSQFYFSRVFRRHFGQPPLKYRQARFGPFKLGKKNSGRTSNE
ncbi:MAG: MmsAB operon regulatory protein [Pedosphaera sp.]|nr:MmsAB operon regulatory protein [Pedosphaera sp.]